MKWIVVCISSKKGMIWLLQILVECYTALKELQNVVLLNLTETWWRSYQVRYKAAFTHCD